MNVSSTCSPIPVCALNRQTHTLSERNQLNALSYRVSLLSSVSVLLYLLFCYFICFTFTSVTCKTEPSPTFVSDPSPTGISQLLVARDTIVKKSK